MLILFQPACFPSSGSEHFNIRKINSQLYQRSAFHSSQVVFVFLPSHPFSSRTQISWSCIPFICEKSLHSFLSMFLSGDSQEDTNGVSSSSFFVLFSSWVDPIQALSSLSFPRFKCFPMPVHLTIVHLSLFISEVPKISQKICVSILNPFKLFWGCYLIQAI